MYSHCNLNFRSQTEEVYFSSDPLMAAARGTAASADGYVRFNDDIVNIREHFPTSASSE